MFRELRGDIWKTAAKVLGGAGAVVFGATLLGLASAHQAGGPPHRLVTGILSALGAGGLGGTMYIPYRKAYLRGLIPSPLSRCLRWESWGQRSPLPLCFWAACGPLWNP